MPPWVAERDTEEASDEGEQRFTGVQFDLCVHSQFDQRVQRGEGIWMDPLDAVPAQITEEKEGGHNSIERNINSSLDNHQMSVLGQKSWVALATLWFQAMHFGGNMVKCAGENVQRCQEFTHRARREVSC